MATVNFKSKLLYALVFIYCVLLAVPCFGEITVFNDQLIGKTMESQVSLVTAISLKTKEELKPDRIETFFEDGKYSAAVVFYQFNKSNFIRIANALDELYHGSEQRWIGSKNKFWRIDERKLGVSLSHYEPCEDNPKENHFLVTYEILK